jgi:3-oxoacyl-[acyl-carrier-protein] synthase III
MKWLWVYNQPFTRDWLFMKANSMNLYLKSVAHYVPPKRLSNEALSEMVDTNDEWIFSRTGIKERAIAEKGVGASDLGTKASELALSNANMEASDLDAILCATCTPDKTIPGAATLIQHKLGIQGVMALDLNAACSGFIYGMDVAEGLLSSGRYKNILLSSTEKFSSVVNYKDRSTCILFGDGAGSVILSSEPGGAKLKSINTGANGSLSHLLHRPAGGSLNPLQEDPNHEDFFIQMEGKEVFKHAVRSMGDSVIKSIQEAGWSENEIDWLIPHQANKRLIKAAADRIGLDENKVLVNIEKYGNMSAASIPVVMSEFQNRFKKGDKILCVAFGAGFTWGGLALEW